MRNRLLHSIAILSVVPMIMLVSCKSGKSVTGKRSGVDNQVSTVVENLLAVKDTTWAAKITIGLNDISFGGIKSIHGSMKAVRGQFVQISIAPLGMEVFRVYCNPQEFVVVNRINKTYCRQPFSAISSKRYNITFDMVQALVCNLMYGNPSAVTSDKEGLNTASFVDGVMETDFYFTLSSELVRTMIRSLDDGSCLIAEYNSFLEGFPRSINVISAVKGAGFSAQINIESITLNQAVSAEAPSLGKSYAQVTLDRMLQGF